MNIKNFSINYFIMNMNDVIADTTELKDDKIKHRGRPRKNGTSVLKTKTHSSAKEIEEDIILNLHISSKDIKNENMNGFEIIQTECCEPSDETVSSLSEESEESDENKQKYQQIIQEKNKLIEELTLKLKQAYDTSRISHDNSNIMKNVKLHLINNPFDTSDSGSIIVPEHTKMACLWDTCEINGVPCFLPDKFCDNTFHVIGWFCSINCATAYNLSLDDFKTSERYSLLKLLYGRTSERIDPAPNYRILDKYGGKITLDEYRKNFVKCEKDYLLMLPPMTYTSQIISERFHEKRITSSDKNDKFFSRHKKKD